MIRSFFISAFILLCASLTQAGILSNITVLPAVPDLCLICVVYMSINNGKLMGETTGFVSGIFMDILSGCPAGLNCVVRTLLGYLGGLFNKSINTDGIFIPALLGLCATVAKALVVFVVSILYPSSVMAYKPLSWLFLFQVGINAVLTPFVFMFLNLFRKSIILKPETIV